MSSTTKHDVGERYWRDGYAFPLTAMSPADALGYREALEAYEVTIGGPILSNMRHQTQFLFTWANELVRNAAVLDAVEAVLGPDILCWSTNFFIKEPQDDGFVSWHQDATYWGLEPHDSICTAWIALSDVPLASGPMKFLAGSHTTGQLAHVDTYDENNLLTRGQEVALEVDESKATDVVLRAGEFSLHHVLLAHGSHPNVTDDRRIGLAARYIPTSAKQTKLRDTAMLVRGVDAYNHFDLMPDPIASMDASARAIHADATQRLVAAVYSGTDRQEMRP